MIELVAKRLVLKKPEHKDLEALVAQIGDWEVAKWLARVPHPYTLDDGRDWLKESRQLDLSLSIFLQGSLIGGIGLTPDEDEYYELGYWLGKDHWGQGFATEAGKALLDHAVGELHLRRIKSSYMKGHAESANVLRKLGFREVGDGEIYSLSRNATLPCVKLLLA